MDTQAWARVRHLLSAAFFLALMGAALWAAEHEVKQLTIAGLRTALHQLSFLQLSTACLGTLLSYSLLTSYDVLGARYAGVRLATPFVMVVSFIAYTLTNNVGFGTVTGTSVRYRFYTRWGVSPTQVFQVFVFCGTTFWLGFTLLAGWALCTGEAARLGRLSFIAPVAPALGVALILVVIGYAAVCALWRGEMTIRGIRVSAPPLRYAVVQPLLGAMDWILAAGVFYCLLPHDSTLGFSAFLHAYLLAQMAGMLSHVPGGLGVFEGLLLYGLGGAVDPQALAGTMIAFRCVYYFLPLIGAIIAMTAIAAGERHGARRPID